MSRSFVPLINTMIVCLLCVLFAQQLVADPPPAPELTSIEPFVIRVGETNQLTLKGKHLQNLKAVWTSRHGVVSIDKLEADVREDGEEARLSFPVDHSTACGPFAIRAITFSGSTGPRIAFLEVLPLARIDSEKTFEGTGYLNDVIQHPGGVEYHVSLERGNELPVDVFAGRLGSKLDPVLTIHGSKGQEELYIQDSPGVGLDCWHVFKAPSTDHFTIRLRDVRYGSGADYRFHIRFGQANHTSSPLARGAGSAVIPPELIDSSSPLARGAGNFDLSATTSITIPHPATDRFFEEFLSARINTTPMAIAVTPGQISGKEEFADPDYFLTLVSTNTVGQIRSFPETAPTETVHGHSSLNGSFENPDQLIRLNLRIDSPGRYRWVAMSRRFGGWSDPAIRLKKKDGKLLQESHLFNNESTLSHEFKEAGTYAMELWDVAGQFGPHASFHIQAQKDPAEFELNSETDSVRIEPGKDAELKLAIDRDGYNGPVKFVITTPVDGVAISDAVAKKGSKETTIKIMADNNLTPGTTFPIKISGCRGIQDGAPRSPLYTQGFWKKQFRDLYSPMFEFEDTIWVTVLPKQEKVDDTEAESEPSDDTERR